MMILLNFECMILNTKDKFNFLTYHFQGTFKMPLIHVWTLKKVKNKTEVLYFEY